MTIDQADDQAKELIRLIKESKVNAIKLGCLKIVDVNKFLQTHESRMNFLDTFSREWKTHYFRLYLLKKKMYNEK